MRLTIRFAALALLTSSAVPEAHCQRIDWRTRAHFYFDNTEFFTPYRVGETIFGGRVTSWLDAATGRRTSLMVGVSADRRWGSSEFSDRAQPVIGFRYRTEHSEGRLGTLDSENRHDLLDAVMIGTRGLTDPIEYGGQWQERRANFGGQIWMNWQQLNTPTQREGFEFGAVLSGSPLPGVSVEAQHLWSHRGGQLYDAEVPVSNNRVTAIGLKYQHSVHGLGVATLSAHRLWNEGHLHPLPEVAPDRGHGTLVRVAVVPKGLFEVFAQGWWGENFSAAAGNPNYGSVGKDGVFYRPSRRYTEIGANRTADFDGDVTYDVGLTFHRVDDEKSIALTNSPWEFSYHLFIKVPFDLVVRKGP